MIRLLFNFLLDESSMHELGIELRFWASERSRKLNLTGVFEKFLSSQLGENARGGSIPARLTGKIINAGQKP
jgi:hypothetical protein